MLAPHVGDLRILHLCKQADQVRSKRILIRMSALKWPPLRPKQMGLGVYWDFSGLNTAMVKSITVVSIAAILIGISLGQMFFMGEDPTSVQVRSD
jgi:hypothetical protein